MESQLAKIVKSEQLSLFRDPDPITWGADGPPTRGLMIRDPYLTDIISQKKTWEIRGFSTNIRGRIGLIKSGSGHVFGEAKIDHVVGPLSLEQLLNSTEIGPHDMSELEESRTLPYFDDRGLSKTFAWVLQGIRAYEPPVAYHHPSGAVTFVDLMQLQNQ